MTQRTFFLDEKATKLLVKDAAEQVIKQLILDRNIRLDEKQIKVLAEATAPHIGVDIDYKRIISTVTVENPLLNDAENLLTPNIRTDLIDRIKGFIPEPVHGKDGLKGLDGDAGKDGLNGEDGQDGKNGNNYKLTKKDRADIAEDTLKGEKVVDMIINQIMVRNEIVSKERFSRKLRELKRLIDSVEKGSKKGMNAGISGQDMIDEITKTFGSEVWQGGGGSASLLIPEITKSSTLPAVAADMLKIIRYTNASDEFFAIQLNSVEPIPLNSWVEIYRAGAGELSIVRQMAATTVIFDGALGDVDFKIDGTEGSIFLRKRAMPDTWRYVGTSKAL